MTKAAHPNLFTRDDTFFGVCEGLGEDLGINANWLRLGIAGGIFFAPLHVAIGYCVMGLIVALSRWIAPNPALSVPLVEVEPDADAARPIANAPALEPEIEIQPLPLAA